MLTNERRLHWTARIVEVATGSTCTEAVCDLGIGTDDGVDGVWALGNWNVAPKRLIEALERAGVELLWSDEYMTCGDCYRLMRCQSDSYHWQPKWIWGPDASEPTCLDCLTERYEVGDFSGDHHAGYVNNPDTALNFPGAGAWLEGQGFAPEEDEDECEREYSNGLHRGMDDEPGPVLERLLAENPKGTEVVFTVSEVSQFYTRFVAYVRTPEDNDD